VLPTVLKRAERERFSSSFLSRVPGNLGFLPSAKLVIIFAAFFLCPEVTFMAMSWLVPFPFLSIDD
jgi:hypothetical protein